jgi:hypothetical protein
MADGLREPQPQRWPALLVLAGVSGMVPWPLLERTHELVEEVAFTARGLLLTGGAAVAADVQAAERVAAIGLVDARVAELLTELRRRVLPPPRRGWQRDGRFGVVPISAALPARRREAHELRPATVAPLPPDEPVFHGEQLIGFTRARSDGSTRIERLTRAGVRTLAMAGVPGRREARFLAVGDGSPWLRVALADYGVALEEGDLAWVVDARQTPGSAIVRDIGGAAIGRLTRGGVPEGAAKEEWRVAPILPPERLAEVAIRFPPGFPLPGDVDVYPFVTARLDGAVIDPRRVLFRLPHGREEGLSAGAAVSIGGTLCGRIARAGFGHSLVRGLADPGFTMPALLLAEGQVSAFELIVRRSCDAGVEVEAPPVPSWDGGVVVTAGGADGCPEGLLVGGLVADGGRCILSGRPDELLGAAVVAWRLPGAWSANR